MTKQFSVTVFTKSFNSLVISVEAASATCGENCGIADCHQYINGMNNVPRKNEKYLNISLRIPQVFFSEFSSVSIDNHDRQTLNFHLMPIITCLFAVFRRNFVNYIFQILCLVLLEFFLKCLMDVRQLCNGEKILNISF